MKLPPVLHIVAVVFISVTAVYLGGVGCVLSQFTGDVIPFFISIGLISFGCYYPMFKFNQFGVQKIFIFD